MHNVPRETPTCYDLVKLLRLNRLTSTKDDTINRGRRSRKRATQCFGERSSVEEKYIQVVVVEVVIAKVTFSVLFGSKKSGENTALL